MLNALKRILSAVCIFSVLFTVISCGGAENEITVTGDETAEEISFLTEKTLPKGTVLLVEKPLSRAVLDEIPIVSPSMTTEELRQIVLDYARLSLTFTWQPTEEWYVSLNRNDTFPVNTLYGGIPYVASSAGNLYKWLCFLDEENGMLDVKAASSAGMDIQNLLGNQCSAHAFSAWSRISNSLTWNGTSQMLQKNGCIKLGDYTFSDTITDFHKQGIDTRQICRDNGKEVMFEAYAKLLPADGLSNYLTSSGHVIMAKEVEIVRKEDGTIDGSKSYVIIYEQTSATARKRTESGKQYRTQYGVDRKFSFSNLYSNGYLPWTIPEFAGLDPIEETEISTSLTEDKVTYSQLNRAKFSSNYVMSVLEMKITGASGTLLFEKRIPVISGNLNITSYSLYNKMNKTVMTSLANGKNTVSITVWLNTGERVTAYEGILIPEA